MCLSQSVCLRACIYVCLSGSVRADVFGGAVSLSTDHWPGSFPRIGTRSHTCPTKDINSKTHSQISGISFPLRLMSRLTNLYPCIPRPPHNHKCPTSRLNIIPAVVWKYRASAPPRQVTKAGHVGHVSRDRHLGHVTLNALYFHGNTGCYHGNRHRYHGNHGLNGNHG